MRLTAMSSSIIHQVMENQINVIYQPDNSLFDHILCSCINEINYYMLSPPHICNIADNCYSLSEVEIDLYNYDICISNEIVSFINQKNNNFSHAFHATNLIFQHKHRPNIIKKEDVALINQRIHAINKIFFDSHVMDTWNCKNAQLIPYGIPLDLFTNNSEERNLDILILGNNGPIIQKIYHHFNSMDIRCEVINNMNILNIQDISKKFKESTIVIDLQDNTINQLCALACGCKVACISNYDNSITQVHKYRSVDGIVEYCVKQLGENNHNISYKEIKEYLEDNYSYGKFKEEISQIMESNKRKAFIL